ncbi:MAG: three-Cys-motif partner protein TcmP [Bacteroidota bacterium]|nr:three-Cys-motif partner protein TcmP [Bacteroidota bacterium]
MERKKDPKKYILPHSEAKLDFYDTYLRRYLRILYLVPYIKKINIFDLFCGTGIYEDGKEGSPIVAFKALRNIIKEYENKNLKKDFTLIINDGEENNIENVRGYLDENNNPKIVNIYYNSYASDLMFSKVIKFVDKFGYETRNLIFIDPWIQGNP